MQNVSVIGGQTLGTYSIHCKDKKGSCRHGSGNTFFRSYKHFPFATNLHLTVDEERFGVSNVICLVLSPGFSSTHLIICFSTASVNISISSLIKLGEIKVFLSGHRLCR